MKKRLLIIFGILLLTTVVLGGFYLLSLMGPRPVSEDTKLYFGREVPDEVASLLDESIALESRFEEILVLRPPESDDMKILAQALDFQRQYIDALERSDFEAEQRLEKLEKRYQDLVAKPLYEESLALEFKADSLSMGGNNQEAREKFQAAADLQKQINQELPLSDSKDLGRVSRLQRQVRRLTAEPLLERSLALESDADERLGRFEWAPAEDLLLQAIDLQDQLNREFRGTNQASVARLEKMKLKLVGIRSGQSFLEIERISELAETRRASGNYLEAADLYLEAARLQSQLNEAYPESTHASSAQVDDFQKNSQTAASHELGNEIKQNHDQLVRSLKQGQTDEAAVLIVELQKTIKQMREVYPRSALNDDELQVKIQYLNLLKDELGGIQTQVANLMLPIPEQSDGQMSRTETPQDLYVRIMGANPSRNLGDEKPVDSVSWVEAKRFCERLTWVLGLPVRLPSENEFRQALGPLRYVVLEKHVWSAADSDGEVQAVAQKLPFGSGYYDLLGNVSEWLESSDRFESEDALHIGGHAQDTLETIFTVPVRESKRAERNRMLGFRFVIASI